jgi:hypothetical protein
MGSKIVSEKLKIVAQRLAQFIIGAYLCIIIKKQRE